MGKKNGKATEEPVRYEETPAPPRNGKPPPEVTEDSELFGPVTLEAVTAFCPGCREDQPIEEFAGADLDLSYDAPAPRCRLCREKGPPPEEPEVMAKLTMTHRRILKAVMTTGNYREAARQAGCSDSYVRNLMKGHGDTSAEFRRAFQMMLEVEGLDFHSLVRMSKLLFYAVEPKWNPGQEKWDFFPDNKVRLGILRHLTKVRQIDPPTVNNFTPTATVVNISTNVGADAEPKDAPGMFTIEAGHVVSSPAIEEEASGGG